MKLWSHPYLLADTEPVQQYDVARVFNSIQNSMDGSGAWTSLHLLHSDGKFVQGGWIPDSQLSKFNVIGSSDRHPAHETQWDAFMHELNALMHRYNAIFVNGISDVQTRFPTLRFLLPNEDKDMCWHVEVKGKKPVVFETVTEECDAEVLYGNPFPDMYYRGDV